MSGYDERRAIGTSTWIPSAPLVFTYERSSSALERFADEVRDADRLHEAVPRLGRVEVEDDVVGPVGLVDARVPGVHVDAVHLHHPDERGGLVDEREVDEPRLALARGQVRNCRVGIQSGLPFGACLWKYAWPRMPYG